MFQVDGNMRKKAWHVRCVDFREEICGDDGSINTVDLEDFGSVVTP